MCVVQPLPPLGLALPWQAPVYWALFLGTLAALGLAEAFGRYGLRRTWGRFSLLGRTLRVAGDACFAAYFGLLALVSLPAKDALGAWIRAQSETLQAHGCDPLAWQPGYLLRVHEFASLNDVQNALVAGFVLSLVLSVIVSRGRRSMSHSAPPDPVLSN